MYSFCLNTTSLFSGLFRIFITGIWTIRWSRAPTMNFSGTLCVVVVFDNEFFSNLPEIRTSNEENIREERKALAHLEFMYLEFMYSLVKYKSSCMKIRNKYLNTIWKILKQALIFIAETLNVFILERPDYVKCELTEKNTINAVHLYEVPPVSSEFLLSPLELCSFLNTFSSL